eukprot:NODE_2061_length_1289_cov_38.447504_g1961_i0.p1 GENE.NODE_2061_length_1289_cov_38.447504_g1961_i0~~NODE_2061_length_1289_cov_38.447504_g1961_i0.p1  ORF type:complete len:410 (-),score=147.08 NODE_2061_length_1289_cov_38.447504_g1961_i0:3-1232(-)
MPKKLYEVLGVSETATPEEIKRAYKHLVLKHHPDKAGEGSADTFKKIQEAYETISDPSKRRLYDLYGEEGMLLLDNDMMGGMSHLFLDPKQAIYISQLIGAAFLLLLLFPVLLALRVDHHYQWNWFIVFLPIFIVDILITILCVLSMVAKDPETGDRTSCTAGLQVLLLVTFTVLVCCGLQGLIHSWVVVFTPWLLLEAMSVMRLPFTLRRDHFEAAQREEEDMQAELGFEPIKHSYLGYVARAILKGLWRPTFALLLLLKVDGTWDAPWGVVFLPFWMLGVGSFISGISMARKGAERVCPDLVCMGCVLGTGILVCLSFFILLAVKLAAVDNGEQGLHLSTVFIPIFIVLGLLVCCCCICQPCIITSMTPAHPQHEREGHDVEAGVSPSSATPLNPEDQRPSTGLDID